MGQEATPSYIGNLLSFYFARRWQSFLTIFSFAVFGFFAIFYLANLLLSLTFILYMFLNSGKLLGLPYLFWSVGFLVALLVPFSASVYALLLCHEIWGGPWKRRYKGLGVVILVITALSVIISADEIIRIVADQDELREFVTKEGLLIGGK